MSQQCVNKGGPGSIVRLERVPCLEEETPLPKTALAALHCWQARPGEVLTVLDPQGSCYRVRLTCLAEDGPMCVPFAQVPAAESILHIELLHALPDKERFELVLQKSTELGVNRIVPLESTHSTTCRERDAQQKKSHRWPDVIRRAARQCRRAMLPELMPVTSLEDCLAETAAELKLMLYENETAWSFTEGFGSLRPQSVALLVGPEGGFSNAEVKQARDAGFLPVSLGPRILRTETAAIVAAALVQSHLGDLR